MSNKEINYKITWEEITDRPESGNYDLFHYGELEFMDKTYPFTLVEMHHENNDWTGYEVTWVEDTPDSFVSELEDAINASYEDEIWKKEQEEIEEYKRLKDIDDEKSWNGIK